MVPYYPAFSFRRKGGKSVVFLKLQLFRAANYTGKKAASSGA